MKLPRRGDMNTPDPEPTEWQLFGAPGVVFALAAVGGILYALAQFFK